jgi:uncharacterized protein with HEPN domain
MSPELTWRMCVENILTCIQKINAYAHGMTYGQFCVEGGQWMQ